MPLYPSYISLKQKILILVVLCALVATGVVAASLLLSRPKQQVADAVLTSPDTIQIGDEFYKLEPTTPEIAAMYGLPEGSTVYVRDPGDPNDPTYYKVIYFNKGEDPAKANVANRRNYRLTNGAYVPEPSNKQPGPIAMAPLNSEGSNNGGTGGTTSNSPQANGGDSSPGKSSPSDGVTSSSTCTTKTAIYTKGSVIYCGKEYKALPANKIDPADLNNTIPPIDKDSGYFYRESEDGGIEIIVAPTSPIDPSSKDVYKTAQKYYYPNAKKNSNGTWKIGTASRSGSETIDRYIPPLPVGAKSSIDPANYQLIEDENEKAIAAYQKEQAEAEQKAKLAQAGSVAADPEAAAAAKKVAEFRAQAINALKTHASEIKGVFGTCGTQMFLTIPAWYNGIVDGNCEIIKPQPGDTKYLQHTITVVILNIVTIILNVVGYASAAFIIYGGYKYMVSAGSPDGMVGARKTIMNAVIGLVISLASIAIVTTIANSI